MTIPKHTSLSLGGNVAQYEYSNKERSKFYDKPDISPYSSLSQQGKGHYYEKKNQVGKGLGADILSGIGGALGGIAGTFLGGPIVGGAGAGAGRYGGRKLAEQFGLGMYSYLQTGHGYQYKSPKNIGLWGTPNSFGAVSMNAPLVL